jgi:hypothetical protein
LPLDYYGPGLHQFYIKNGWNAAATSANLQLGFPGSHGHLDYGTFQIRRGNRWLTKETTGYSSQAAGFGGNGLCLKGSNDMLNHNGIVFTGRGWTIGPASGYPDGIPTPLRLESQPDYAYAAVDLSKAYQARTSNYEDPPGVPRDDNPFAKTLVREFLFVRPLETMVVFDRIEAESDSKWGTLLPAVQVVKTFLLHSLKQPTVQDSNHILLTNGNQALRLTTLVPAKPRYTVVDDSTNVGAYAASHPDWFQYRLEVNDSGAAQSYFLSVLQARDASGADLTTSLTEDGTSFQVTLTHPTLGTAIVKFQKGMTSTGGQFGYAASGSPVLADLTDSVQNIAVTDNGPVWGQVPSKGETRSAEGESRMELAARPNPFNPAVSISFRVGAIHESPVHVSVYNAAGILIANLVHQSLAPGRHTVTWDAAQNPSGVYVVRMEAGGRLATKRILLLK